MFGYFRKKREARAQSEAGEGRLKNAFDRGALFSKIIEERIDSYMVARYAPVKRRYLDVFKGTVLEAFNAEDVSPIIAVRIEYDILRKNVGELGPRIINELAEFLDDLRRAFKDTGDYGDPNEAIEKYINIASNQFQTDLILEGYNLLTEYAALLKEADDAWRRNNPELAKHLPLDE